MTFWPVRWIVTDWRLKLLALVLAVGLLAGVAFSENPPTLDTVSVHVDYHNIPDGLVVIDPPTTVDVPVAGFRSDVARYRASSAGVVIDLSNAHAGRQTYTAVPRTDLPGLQFRQSSIQIRLDIETSAARLLDIEVRTRSRSPGIAVVPEKTYAICGNANDHCQVWVRGPQSLVEDLRAFAMYDVPITAAATGSSPDQPVRFEAHGVPIDLSNGPRTLPSISWTPKVVTVVVTTQGGSQTKTVPVNTRTQGAQACGYQIAGVDVQPNVVTVSGPVDAVSRVNSVNMDPIVLTGMNASQRLIKGVAPGVAGVLVEPSQVVVNVNVAQSFTCAAPPPTPAAGVAPATPSSTPTPSPSAT
jgi:YbbR domain-containing protein